MTQSSKPVDTAQRVLALDPLQSFICEAPAGSGKTELLTQRVLTLLARVKQPEAILAITFTRKAAAEMRDRILGALISGQGIEPIDDHEKTTWKLAQDVLSVDKCMGWHLLQNPNRLQIRTFDSLCAMLTQALPLHSSLGANIGISNNAESLYKEAVTDLLKTLEQDVAWAESLSKLLAHLDNKYERVEGLLVNMLRSRDAWMPVIGGQGKSEDVRRQLEAYLQSAIKDKIQKVSTLLPDNCKQAILELGGFAAANIISTEIDSPISSLVNIDVECQWSTINANQWLGIASLFLTKTGGWRKRLDKKGGFPAGVNKLEKEAFKLQKEKMLNLIAELQSTPEMLDTLKDIVYWPSPIYKDSQWQILQALTSILPILIAHLQLVFRTHGEVDFLEMGARANHALGTDEEPTDLVLRLDHSIQHILADEFQDTSFTQINLLQKLTAGWVEGDGRTLFCVGDAMQSIYGFRGANVGLFLHCKSNGLGDIPLQSLQLTTNFRSQAGLVQWLNSTFKQAFPQENDISSGAVVYAHADIFRPELSGPAVQTHLYSPDAPASCEGELIVKLVDAVRNETPDATISILVRNKNHAKSAVAAFKSANMRFRAVDLEALAQQTVIQDLMSLTQALLYPEDRIAWLAVLRAPWCGLELKDLDVISQQISNTAKELVESQVQRYFTSLNEPNLEVSEGSSCELSLSGDGYDRLIRVAPILRKALEDRSRKPLRQWLEGTWVKLGGPACLSRQSDCENAERFFQCLEGLNELGELPKRQELVDSVNSLFSAPDPEADDRLQIMSIHKSKGLEFDVVILPGLHRRPRGQDSELLLWQERLSLDGQDEWLLAPISAVGEEKDPIYKHLEHERAARERLEACRLLYVACTRAKKSLHLLAQVQPVEGEVNSYKPPSSSSLLASIWSSIEGSVSTFAAEHTEDGEAGEKNQAPLRKLLRLPADWQAPILPEVSLLAPYVAHYEFDNEHLIKGLMQPQSQLPRYVGTLLHQILQTIGEQGLECWSNKDLQELEPFWRARLVSLGVKDEEAQGALPQIMECIQKILKSERFAWLMSGECQFEYPLSGCVGDKIQHSVIDLLMTDKHGQVWIVDYKTSSLLEGEGVDSFIAKEMKSYRQQMRRYQLLLEQLGHQKIRCALFFVMKGVWSEYDNLASY